MKDTLSFYQDGAGDGVLNRLSSAVRSRGIEKVVFIGMGSSYFVSYVAAILPLQLMVDAYAKRHGSEAGSFSHGAKVTKVE